MTDSPTPTLRFHVDGAEAERVHIPSVFVRDSGNTVNLTRIEVGGGAKDPPQKRGRDVLGKKPLDKIAHCLYLYGLDGAIEMHTDPDTDTIAVDVELGLWPWKEHAADAYKVGLSEEEFEMRAQVLFLQAIDKGNEAGLKTGIWGMPTSWENFELSDRIAVMYERMTALHPEMYIRHSDNHEEIRAHSEDARNRCEHIESMFPTDGPPRTTVAWLWDRYVHGKGKASIPDMVAAFESAAWADQRVLWLHAGSKWQADDINKEFMNGGRLHNFCSIALGLGKRDPDATGGVES